MNYEKAYKDALERAKSIHNEHRAQCHDVMTKVFPELAESEGERIRKYLMDYVKSAGVGHSLFDSINTRENILLWLEKQGEQKLSWCEEDEKIWTQVINEIEAIKSSSSTIFEKNIAQDKIYWLKSLKYRIKGE